MISREEIRKHLLEDPDWEPPENSPPELVALVNDIYNEMFDKGELRFSDGLNTDSLSWDDDY